MDPSNFFGGKNASQGSEDPQSNQAAHQSELNRNMHLTSNVPALSTANALAPASVLRHLLNRQSSLPSVSESTTPSANDVARLNLLYHQQLRQQQLQCQYLSNSISSPTSFQESSLARNASVDQLLRQQALEGLIQQRSLAALASSRNAAAESLATSLATEAPHQGPQSLRVESPAAQLSLLQQLRALQSSGGIQTEPQPRLPRLPSTMAEFVTEDSRDAKVAPSSTKNGSIDGSEPCTAKESKTITSDESAEKEISNNNNNAQSGKDDDDTETGNEEVDEGQQETFPYKVYRMLLKAETDGKEHIISFTPSNKCFRIHKPVEFATEIMPEFFTTSRMSSFQRQLNLYGFRRITEGADKGGYFHEHLEKGNFASCAKIKRKKTTVKARGGVFPGIRSPFSDGLVPQSSEAVGSSRDVLLSSMTPPSLSVRQLLAVDQMRRVQGASLSLSSSSSPALPPGVAGLPGLNPSTADLERQLLQQQLQQRQAQEQNELIQQLLFQGHNPR